MKFDQLVDFFLHYLTHVKGASPHTVRNYAIDLAHFQRVIPEIENVNKQGVRSYLAELARKGAARRSVVRKLSTLRSFFSFLLKEKLWEHNPMLEIDRPKVPKVLPTILTYEQVERLFGLPDSHSYFGLRDRALMELFYSSGLRLSELVGTNRVDFDPVQQTIRVMGKGKRERIVPMTATACAWLTKYLESKDRTLKGKKRKGEIDRQAIFLNRWGKRLSARSVDRLFKMYLCASGIVGCVTPHTIRHTIATHWLEKGMNLKIIQMLLGHKSLATTTIYTQVSPRLKREIYQKAHPLQKKKSPGKR